MRKNRIRLTESQLHRVIKESVNKVLRESWKEDMFDDYNIPTSWKEHDNGIATYNKYGDNIGDDVFDAPYYGDSEESQNRRGESHLAWDYAHPEKSFVRGLNNYYHFSHSDNDSKYERPHRYTQGDDEIWKGVNKPQKPQRDRKLERALDAADKRPLHRKGSLNREL